MKRIVISLFLFVLAIQLPLYAKTGSDDAKYIGGTVSTIKEGTDGRVSTKDEKNFTFDYKGGQLGIPYDKVNSLEYGQKAGRRVGLAIVISPIALLSKKRKHFLTLNYIDQSDKEQAVVFELGKDVVRVTLSSLEARTGRKIEYQDEEARKSSKGN
jgi:hypothetical protein